MAGDLPTARSTATLALGDDPAFLQLIDAIPAHVLCGELQQGVQFADTMWSDWQRSGRPHVYWMWVTLPFVVLAHGLRGDQAAAATWWARLDELTGTPGQLQRLRPLSAYVTIRITQHTQRHPRRHGTGRARRDADHRPLPPLRPGRGRGAGRRGPAPRRRRHPGHRAASGPPRSWPAPRAACTPTPPSSPSRSGYGTNSVRVERASTLLLLPDRAEEGHAELTALGVPRT